jgi:hypothetical protein
VTRAAAITAPPTFTFSLELRPSVSLLPGSPAMVRRVVGTIFGHRHRRLEALFG